MRTLRSGKSLPETPPIVRQSTSQIPNVKVTTTNKTPSRRGSTSTSKANENQIQTPRRRISEVSMSNESNKEKVQVQASRRRISVASTSSESSKEKVLPVPEPKKSVTPNVKKKIEVSKLETSELKEDTEKQQASKITSTPVSSSKKSGIVENVEEVLEKDQEETNEEAESEIATVTVPISSEDKGTPTKRAYKKRSAPVYQTPTTERLAKTEICPVCGLGFTRKATLIKHSKIHEEEAPEPPPKPTIPRRGRPGALSKSSINCDMCNLTFTRKAHLDRHLLLHSGVKPFKCDVCKLTFSRKDHMLAHRTKHGETKTGIRCTLCDQPFATMKALDEHVAQEHPTPDANPDTHICETCGKRFLQKRYLQAHRRLHMSNVVRRKYVRRIPFIPQSKAKITNTNVNVARIQKMTRPQQQPDIEKVEPIVYKNTSGRTKNQKPMVLINRVVKLSADLALKSRKGSTTDVEVALEDGGNEEDEVEEMDYDYETMVKQFPVVENSRDESSEDTYADSGVPSRQMECSVCGKPFNDRSELRKHYRVHKKKFICRFCGLRMASAGSLMRHNLTHTNMKNFKCDLCGQKFNRKDSLKVHQRKCGTSTTRRIYSPQRFLCRFCGSSFSMKNNLVKHLKTFHSNLGTRRNLPLYQETSRFQNDSTGASGQSHSDKDMVISLNPFDLDGLPQQYQDTNSGEHKIFPTGIPSSFLKSELMDYDEGNEANLEYQNNNESMQAKDVERQLFDQDDDGDAADSRTPDGDYICNHCGKRFKNSKSLNTHKWYHSRDRQFVCSICNRGFKYSTDLSRHITTHAVTKNASSASAKKPTQNINISQLKLQQPAHYSQARVRPRLRGINSMETRPFGCKLCPQRFNHRSNLSRHVRLLHNGNNSTRKRIPDSVNLQMYLQKLQATTSDTLQTNRIQAQTMQGNTIQQGGKEDSWKSWDGMNLSEVGEYRKNSYLSGPNYTSTKLGQDMSVSLESFPDSSFSFDPTSATPYACGTCGKAFQHKSNLWTHMRIHNKLFMCQFCNMKTATHGDLVLHLRTHTGERPYKCAVCDWKFSRKSALNKHVQKYHTGGGDVKQPWKYREDRESGNLKFKFVRSSDQKEGFQMQHLQHKNSMDHSASSGMTISQIPSSTAYQKPFMGARSQVNLIPTTSTAKTGSSGTTPILQSALQSSSGDSGRLASHLAKFANGMADINLSHKSPALAAALGSRPFKRPGPGRPPNASSEFLCRQCNQRIRGKANYIDHMKTHNLASATSNSKSVDSLNNLSSIEGQNKVLMDQTYEDTNSDPRPFKCSECGQSFGQKAHLTRHMISHQNSEAARCDLCGKICSSLGFLSRHYQYIHPEHFNPAEHARFRISDAEGTALLKRQINPAVPEVLINEEEYDDDEDNIGDPNVPPNTKPSYIYKKMAEEAEEEQIQNQYSRSEIRRTPQSIIQKDSFNAINLQSDAFSSLPFTITQVIDTSESLSPCERCGKEFTTKKSRSDHVWYCKREKSLRCPVSDCNKVFKLKHDVVRHVKRHTNDKRFPCDHCQSRFYHKKDLDRHLRSVHKMMLSDCPFPCDFCEVQCMTELNLNRHMKMIHGFDNSDILEYRGEGDDEQTGSLQTSPQNSLNEDEEYEEFEIDDEMDNEDSQDGVPDPSSFLEQSMGVAHDDYYCKLCDISFPDRRNFMNHQYYHIREARHSCNQCGERFKLKSNLDKHMMTYHNDQRPAKIIWCRYCPKKFTRHNDFKIHMITVHPSSNNNAVTSNNPLSILKKTLVISDNERHESQDTSTSPKANKTSIAVESDTLGHDETLKGSSTIQEGQSIEAGFQIDGDGKYKCDLCGKILPEKKSLDAHKYYHTREHKYSCNNCSAKFKQNSDLQRHNRIHHSSASAKKSSLHCPLCFRSFSEERYMSMHIRKYHSESSQPGESLSSSVEGNSPNMSKDNGKSPKTSKDGSNRLSSEDQPHINIKQEPVDYNDDNYEDDGCNTGVWNAKENLVDLTIEENQDLDEEEASNVIQSWGGPSASEIDIDDTEEDLEEELEYINYRDMNKQNSIKTGSSNVTRCAVTCGSCGTDFVDTQEIERHVCPNPIRGGETSTAERYNGIGATTTGNSFPCNICGAKFSRSNELILHNRIHTGLKPFSCKDCGLNFVQRADLNAHLQAAHNKSMATYDCPFCPKKFLVRKSLDSHRRRNHGNIIQFYNCSQCGRQFTAQRFLEAHARNCNP